MEVVTLENILTQIIQNAVKQIPSNLVSYSSNTTIHRLVEETLPPGLITVLFYWYMTTVIYRTASLIVIKCGMIFWSWCGDFLHNINCNCNILPIYLSFSI